MAIPIPNYTQVPNMLFELMPLMSQAEFFVTMAIVRKIIGYHKERDAISLSQLQEMTGMSRTTVLRGVESALERGIIREDGQGVRNTQYFTLNFTNDISQNDTGSNSVPVTSSNSLPVDALTGSNSVPTKESLKEKRKKKDSDVGTSGANEVLSTASNHESKLVATPDSKPKKPRKPNPLFDAIAQELFKMQDAKAIGGLVAKVANSIKVVKEDATAEDVKAFVAWYRGKYPTMDLPKSSEKVAIHFQAWLDTKTATNVTTQVGQRPRAKEVTSIDEVIEAGTGYILYYKNFVESPLATVIAHKGKWAVDGIWFRLTKTQLDELKTRVRIEERL